MNTNNTTFISLDRLKMKNGLELAPLFSIIKIYDIKNYESYPNSDSKVNV